MKLGAAQNYSSTTLANVPGMSFAVASGRTYRFEFWLPIRSNTLTTGIGIAVTFPTASTIASIGRTIIAADGAGAELQGAVTASADAVISTAVVAINTDYLFKLEGILIAGGAGMLQLQARAETTGTVTVGAGSTGLLWDFGA